jgi:hypothetical protein
MQFPVKERAQKLRQEIAEITNANQSYVNSNRTNVVAAAERERRLQRLLEILDELRAFRPREMHSSRSGWFRHMDGEVVSPTEEGRAPRICGR